MFNADNVEERNDFLAENYNLILWFANKLKMNQSKLSFDDCMEIVSMAAIKAADTWNPEKGTFANHLDLRIKSELHKALKETRNQMNHGIEMHSYDALEDPDEQLYYLGQYNTDEEINVMEESDWLRWAISKLDEREQDIIKKYYWENKDCRAIGKELGISFQRVAQLMKRAIIKLKRLGGIDVEY